MSLYLLAMGTTDNDIQSVKSRHSAELMALPGVVSVGIGLNTSANPAIVIGIERPDPQLTKRLPEELEGYPVEVRVIGEVRTQ